jgi:hypothetical protein
MTSPSPIVHPGRPTASQNAVFAHQFTSFKTTDSTSSRGVENNSILPGSWRPGNAEDHLTLTERVLAFLDKHSA